MVDSSPPLSTRVDTDVQAFPLRLCILQAIKNWMDEASLS